MSLDAGTRVGRYTITRLLAQGGMAEVYRAEQDLAQGITRPVAVKLIRPEYSASQDFREMFLDEARTACTLSHPNIAHIYEVGESEDGQLFMAMELVVGETLATINRTLREHQQRLSNEALFAVGVATAGALEAVHALKTEGGTVNLVHRDVSPHNLLLSSSGALKLIDFGIAKAVTNRNLTMPGVTKGKAGYFSPEQAMGKKLDGRSDLFSLGVTLYKLASGETPFDDFKTHAERHAALVRGQFKRLDEVYRGLPRGFYDVVTRALAVKPDDRFQSARDMREALERAAFEARLRLGQSSLVGYVDDNGDITASGGARVSSLASDASPADTLSDPEHTGELDVDREEAVRRAAKQAKAAPTLEIRTPSVHDTSVTRTPLRLSRLAIIVGAFVASLALGVFGTLWFFAGPTTPSIWDAGVPSSAAPVDRAEPDAATAVALPEVVATKASEPRDAGHQVVRVVPVRRPPVVRQDERPKEEVIPSGEGQLRIQVVSNGRANVMVGADDWGQPPVNHKVNSGAFRVTVHLSDGASSSTRVVVMPDQTTIVTYDAASQRWSSRSQ